MRKKTAVMLMAAVTVVAVSVDVCWCSLDTGVAEGIPPTPQDQKSDSWGGWLHGMYKEAFNSDDVDARDAGRNLMESTANTAAKMKDTVNSAASGASKYTAEKTGEAANKAYETASDLKDVASDMTDRVIRMVGSSSVDAYDFHADWPSDEEDEEVRNERNRCSDTTSHSKLDKHMARMANSVVGATGMDSDSDGDFTDHIIEGIDYGRSRISNSYDHAKQNVNAGIDKVAEKGADARDAVGKAMEHWQERYTHLKDEAKEKVHTAPDKARDEMRAFDESRHRVGDACDSAKERMTREAKATYESAKEKLSEATGAIGDKIKKDKEEL